MNPCPGVGCNKPMARRAEQAVKVVRNHEGGTWHGGGTAGPEGSLLPGVDARRYLGGGATFERISREEATARAGAGDTPSALKGRSKPTRAEATWSRPGRGTVNREYLGDPGPATARKVREGAGKTNDPLRIHGGRAMDFPMLAMP